MRIKLTTRDGPRRRTRKQVGWIGVDVGTGAIKVAQLCRQAGQTRIVASGVAAAESGRAFEARDILDGTIGRQVRTLMARHDGFVGKNAACVLSMSLLDFRTLIHAKGSEEEQREIINLELSTGGVSREALREFDFWDTMAPEREGRKGMSHMNVLSLPRRLSDSLARQLTKTRLKCQVLDGIPFTLTRAAELISTSSSDVGPVGVIDWGCSGATLVVTQGGRPLFTRVLKGCGFEQLRHDVSRRLELSARESVQLLARFGLDEVGSTTAPDDPRSVVTQLAQPTLDRLDDELNRTLAYLRDHVPDASPRRLLLLGGGSTIRNVIAHLRARVRLPLDIGGLQQGSTESRHPSSLLANASALSALAWEL